MKLDDLLKKICYGSEIVIIDEDYNSIFNGVYSKKIYDKFTYTMKQKEVIDIFCSNIGRMLIKVT